MMNQKNPIILILVILVTPIASAFDHCSDRDVIGHLSENQSLTVTVSIKDEALLRTCSRSSRAAVSCGRTERRNRSLHGVNEDFEHRPTANGSGTVDLEQVLNQKGMLKGDTSNLIDMNCHAGNSCSFNLCDGYGITSPVATVNTVISLYYLYFGYLSPYDTVLSTDLRPPIIVL